LKNLGKELADLSSEVNKLADLMNDENVAKI